MQPLVWLLGLWVYLGVVFAGSLAWEVLHLPLYTIWAAGTLREQAFAAGHCTLGDLVIAAGAMFVMTGVPNDRLASHVRFQRRGAKADIQVDVVKKLVTGLHHHYVRI